MPPRDSKISSSKHGTNSKSRKKDFNSKWLSIRIRIMGWSRKINKTKALSVTETIRMWDNVNWLNKWIGNCLISNIPWVREGSKYRYKRLSKSCNCPSIQDLRMEVITPQFLVHLSINGVWCRIKALKIYYLNSTNSTKQSILIPRAQGRLSKNHKRRIMLGASNPLNLLKPLKNARLDLNKNGRQFV